MNANISTICFDSKRISQGSAKHFVYYKLNAKQSKRDNNITQRKKRII